MSRSTPVSPHFRTAVDAILKNWTALQLAISQGAGGTKGAVLGSWLGEALVQWFSENRDLEPYEVTDFLESVLNRELDLLIEDGSSDEVGTLICDFFKICSTKTDAEIIEKVRTLPRCDLSRCQIDRNDSEMADDSIDTQQTSVEQNLNEMELGDETPSKPRGNYVDEEGWTVIVKNKK